MHLYITEVAFWKHCHFLKYLSKLKTIMNYDIDFFFTSLSTL